ncbi:MAG: hypothetical protein HQ567_24920 [Candidatus Nealsonbacteria bacterium]|nr:hypothetical protein [Candidatus Nealsonbacteria bacterium]
MKTELASVVVLVLLGGLAADSASAQQGMGQATGVAMQGVRPDVVSLSGKVREIDTGPCESTYGVASIGIHLVLETPAAEELKIHLGSAVAADFIADQLSVGKKVTVNGFRTARMPENHFVAQVVTFDGKSIRLRDANL